MDKTNKNITAAQALLTSYGSDSLSYFSLHENKLFFFSSSGQSFLSYVIKGRVALVSGDPIGPSYDIPKLLTEFSYFVKGANLTACFLAVSDETVQMLEDFGHLQIGKEAIIQLKDFNKQGLKKKVRRAERYIQNLGITCRIFTRKEIPYLYLNQLHQVSDEWLKDKGGKEKRLTMSLGRIPTELDPDCEIVLALKHDEVLGYVTFVPIYAANSLSLDSMRKKKHVPNGLTEFLLLQSLEHFKKRGIASVSLNFATFHYMKDDFKTPSSKLLLSPLYKLLSRIYMTDSLHTFNNKFLPDWKNRYFVFEKKRYLPSYLYAIAKTEL